MLATRLTGLRLLRLLVVSSLALCASPSDALAGASMLTLHAAPQVLRCLQGEAALSLHGCGFVNPADWLGRLSPIQYPLRPP